MNDKDTDTPQTFHLRQGKVMRGDLYTLDGSLLTRQGAWKLDLDTVQRASFVDRKIERVRATRFDMFDGRRPMPRMRAIDAPGTLTRTTAPNPAFMDLLATVVARLAARDPDLPISIGEYGLARWASFLGGIVWVLVMVLLTIWLLRAGFGGAWPVLVAALFGGLAVYGGFHAWQFRPWRPLDSVRAADFAAMLAEDRPD